MLVKSVKSVQSALSDLLTTSATHGTFSRPSGKRGLISIIKLMQFNYSRSLITNRGTVERGIGHIAKNYYAPLGRET